VVQSDRREFKVHKDLQWSAFKVFEVQQVHRACKDFKAFQAHREMKVM
jgi:hypothetical protein